jgi:hypothetical protein
MNRLTLGAIGAAISLVIGCSAAPVDDDVRVRPATSGVDPNTTCERLSNLRPVYPLSTCPGQEKNGALCYTPCSTGYHGAGPVCWQDCPAGYTDDGATCRRDAHIISADNGACPWYDKCGLTFAKGCSTCPSGYTNDGCTCRRDVDIFAKRSYGRGVGSPMSCEVGQQQIGALCYAACPSGWTADGIHCLGSTVCHDDPPPPTPVQRYCFKVTRDSDITPCTVVVQLATSEAQAQQIVQSQNVGDDVTMISCNLEQTACAAPRSPIIKKPGGLHRPID